jgi:thioesterase domain-containing protein
VLAEAVVRGAAGNSEVLVGYSVGGAIAHAVAETLESDGLVVAGLVLIDTYVPHGAAAERGLRQR